MKSNVVFKELEYLAEKLEIRIMQEKGNFQGGYCLLKEEKIIVINKLKPIEQRISALVNAFANFDTSNIYMKPFLRRLIKSKDKSP